jgi:hypothetical protein
LPLARGRATHRYDDSFTPNPDDLQSAEQKQHAKREGSPVARQASYLQFQLDIFMKKSFL